MFLFPKIEGRARAAAAGAQEGQQGLCQGKGSALEMRAGNTQGIIPTNLGLFGFGRCSLEKSLMEGPGGWDWGIFRGPSKPSQSGFFRAATPLAQTRSTLIVSHPLPSIPSAQHIIFSIQSPAAPSPRPGNFLISSSVPWKCKIKA